MIRCIKGFKDILPEDLPSWRVIKKTAHKLAQCYGYSEVMIPLLEYTDLFTRSIGGGTDIVEKEMYTFQDKDGSLITLRPEGTAGVVRSFLEHRLFNIPKNKKLYYIGPMFRHERPQAGRLRQFHQFGVEAFDITDSLIDVEVIALLWNFFSFLEIPQLTLEINTLGTQGDRKRYIQQLKDFLVPHLQHLCENCRRRYQTNPLRILDCKVPTCRLILQHSPHLCDDLSPLSREHFQGVLEGLTTLNIPFTHNHYLVRGLDYYTRTTFEVTTPALGAQSTLGAGGRYDGLIESLGGQPTPAIGFAVGLERVALLLPPSLIPPSAPLIFMAAFGNQGRQAGIKIIDELRKKGLIVETDYQASTLRGHLKKADRLSALITIILGDNEVQKGSLILRDMQTKEQKEILISQVSDILMSRIQKLSLPTEIY